MQQAKVFLHKLLQSAVCSRWRSRWEMTAESAMPLLCWCYGIHGKVWNFLSIWCYKWLPAKSSSELRKGVWQREKRSWQKCRNSCSLPELGGAHGISRVVATLLSYIQARTGRDSIRSKLTDLQPRTCLWSLHKRHCRTLLHSPGLKQKCMPLSAPFALLLLLPSIAMVASARERHVRIENLLCCFLVETLIAFEEQTCERYILYENLMNSLVLLN